MVKKKRKSRVSRQTRPSRLSKIHIRKSYAKLNAPIFGLAGGIISGVFFALITLLGLTFGWGLKYLAILQGIYGFLGYSVSGLGVFLGAIYGFIDGFVIFWIMALLYNCMTKSK